MLLVAPSKRGGVLGPRTINVKVFVLDTTPSLTATRTEFVLSACAAVGIQASTPFVTTKPAGPCCNVTVNACTGTSESCGTSACVWPAAG